MDTIHWKKVFVDIRSFNCSFILISSTFFPKKILLTIFLKLPTSLRKHHFFYKINKNAKKV